MKQVTLKKNLTSGLIAFILGIVLYAAIPYCIKVKLQFSSSAFGPRRNAQDRCYHYYRVWPCSYWPKPDLKKG